MSETLERQLKHHRRLVDEYFNLPWWRFIKRRKLQRDINSYAQILINALVVRTTAWENRHHL